MNDDDLSWLSPNGEQTKPKREAMPPRRRVKKTPKPGATAVNMPDPDMDDPEYLELLKIYFEDSDNDDDERENFIRDRENKHSQSTPLLTQGAAYMLLIGCVGFFILFVNYYNVKQLERLKSEYGLDEKNPEPEFWWKKSLIYRIYVQSFRDSDGDGIGDLMGIRQKIDHLHYLHIDAVLLSPIFDSPMVDQGRDALDFKTINPKFGTMDDFKQLVEELHQLGIKLILEFTPNHTSRLHKWFRQSRKAGVNNPYSEFYIWHSGRLLENGTREPPSNWISKYGGPAWTWDNERRSFYYHYYHESIPDLNHRENGVRLEMAKVFQYWLDYGVDGVMADGIHVLFETEEVTLDEPPSENEELPKTEHDSLDHIFTMDQPEVHEYLGSWKDAIDAQGLKHKKKIPFFVCVEDESMSDMAKYYYTGGDAPLSPMFSQLTDECGGVCIHDIVDAWITHVPTDNDVLWMASSADHGRSTRFRGTQYQSAYNMLMMLIPGIVVTYYGEEIGMDQLPLSDQHNRDIMGRHILSHSRDPGRGPMQWSDKAHAGFTEGDNTWLPVHYDYATVNVEAQQNDPSTMSTLQLYQRLATLRKYPSFLNGKMQYSVINDKLFSFLRFAKDNAPYLIALNFGTETASEDFSFTAGVGYGKVVAHAKGKKVSEGIREGEKVNLGKLKLEPGEGIVVLLLMD